MLLHLSKNNYIIECVTVVNVSLECKDFICESVNCKEKTSSQILNTLLSHEGYLRLIKVPSGFVYITMVESQSHNIRHPNGQQGEITTDIVNMISPSQSFFKAVEDELFYLWFYLVHMTLMFCCANIDGETAKAWHLLKSFVVASSSKGKFFFSYFNRSTAK